MILDFLRFMGTNTIALGIASICGIIGFILTLIVTIRTSNISKVLKHNAITSTYNRERKAFQNAFDGHRASILEDDMKTDRHLKAVLANVESYYAEFHSILSVREKIILWRFKKVLKKEAKQVNFNTVCNYLALLSGRLSKKEVKKNG